MATQRIQLAALAAASLSLVVCSARSQTVLLGNSSTDSVLLQINTTQWYDVSFTTPSIETTVTAVTFFLGAPSNPPFPPTSDQGYDTADGDVALAGIYANNGSQPGALVGSPLVNPSSSDQNAANFTFVADGPLTLSANTTYWLQLQAKSGAFQWWSGSQAPSGPATFNYTTFTSTTAPFSYVHFPENMTFSIYATPEPNGLWAAGLTAAGFALWRRRAALRRPTIEVAEAPSSL